MRLVVADDDVFFAHALRAVLTEHEVDVAGLATDGESAVKLVAELLPDVVVLDLDMPRASGFDVMDELRARGSETRIVVLTGGDDARDRGRAAERGATAFLLKSQPLDEIAEEICLVGALSGVSQAQ